MSADKYPRLFPRKMEAIVYLGLIMNTIASRDQFKPIRIGENLVVNYNNC